MPNEPSATKVGYKQSLVPGIIWRYVSVGRSGVGVKVGLFVLEARGCCESYITCGGPLSSADSALSGRLSNCFNSAMAAACICGLSGVA